jgi:large subunit ribosomal protein L6
MSRIGRIPIPIPLGVKVSIQGRVVEAQGPKGKLTQIVHEDVGVTLHDNTLVVTRNSDQRGAKALHGLTRSLLANMIKGVKDGFEKKLEVVGIGYRGQLSGKVLTLSLGYSHPVVYTIPDGISMDLDKQTLLTIRGADKCQVGQVAAEIRAFRKPDPYKGKGIKYADEVIRRKAGKAGAK